MPRSGSTFVSRSLRRPASGDDAQPRVMWVRGAHDVATAASLTSTMDHMAYAGNLVLDLSGVTFMDASTVTVIVSARERLRRRSLSLHVREPSRAALRVLQLCDLAHLVLPKGGDAVLGPELLRIDAGLRLAPSGHERTDTR